MKVVNSYKYLGIFFTTKVSLSYACEDLISRGKKAVVDVMKKVYKLENHSMYVFIKSFDAQVQPIVLYGAERWEIGQASRLIEKLHLFSTKKLVWCWYASSQ